MFRCLMLLLVFMAMPACAAMSVTVFVSVDVRIMNMHMSAEQSEDVLLQCVVRAACISRRRFDDFAAHRQTDGWNRHLPILW